MDEATRDLDARPYYASLTDPDATFNRMEITLSHLFRRPHPALGDRTYGECLFRYLDRLGYIRDEILEVGGGLGDVARGFLESAIAGRCHHYTMYDISPALLDRQRNALGSFGTEFVSGDALELTASFSSFTGLLLCNGVMADLRSVLVGPDDPLTNYGTFDTDIRTFSAKYFGSKRGFLHIGTLLFLREIAASLKPGSTAALLEYSATSHNQPSWFETHFECGIDFDQIEAYALRLGFATRQVNIEEILGLDPGAEFLSIDVFTRQKAIAVEIPGVVKLWDSERELDVLAYTRESLREALGTGGMGFGRNAVESLMENLESAFYSLHDPRFDTKNPTTWGYKCLLLEKSNHPDWGLVGEAMATEILAEYHGIPPELARARIRQHIGERDLQLGSPADLLIEAVICGFLWDSLKKYGPVTGVHLLREALTASVALPLPRHQKDKLLAGVARVLGRLER